MAVFHKHKINKNNWIVVWAKDLKWIVYLNIFVWLYFHKYFSAKQNCLKLKINYRDIFQGIYLSSLSFFFFFRTWNMWTTWGTNVEYIVAIDSSNLQGLVIELCLVIVTRNNCETISSSSSPVDRLRRNSWKLPSLSSACYQQLCCTEIIARILCMHLGACRFFPHPTALMHLKSILSKCIQLHFIFLAHTRMGSHLKLL